MKTINEMGKSTVFIPCRLDSGRRKIQEHANTLFEGKRGPKPMAAHRYPERLYSEMELDWLKKSPRSACDIRQAWIDKGDAVAVVWQCAFLARSGARTFSTSGKNEAAPPAASVVRPTLLYIWRLWPKCAPPGRSTRTRGGSDCDGPGTV